MPEIGAIKTPSDSCCLPKLSISPLEAKLWTETRTALLLNQPAFADVWFRMMQDKDKKLAWFTDYYPIAATNDQIMFINPKTYFKFKLLHRVFIACHEICHAIFNHCGMMYTYEQIGHIAYSDGLFLPYVNDICQISTDCLINDLLVNGKVGEMPVDDKGNKLGAHGRAGITYMDNIASAYRKLFEEIYGRGKQGVKSYEKEEGAQNRIKPEGFDVHLKPGQGTGKTPTQAQDERNPQEWDNALHAALASAKSQGRLPDCLERGLAKLLIPKIDWRDHLNLTLSKRLGVDFSTWNALDNELMLRGIGAPGKAKIGCECIVFATDSSGSIGQSTCDMFNTEGVRLMEQARPRQLIYIQCDAKVQEYVDIDDPSDLVRKIKGGGGTNFRPVFERVAAEGLEPDVLIYLTDLYGTFPSKPPSYPVIWVTINTLKAPFGDTIQIPAQI